MSEPGWPRWTLLFALLVLGAGYICVFAFFLAYGRDFVVALHNQRAREASIAAPIEVPKTVEFLAGSAGSALLGSGWYTSEPVGTWSTTSDSWIALVLRTADVDVEITLNGTVFVARHHSKIVITADVDEHQLGMWQRTFRNASEPLRFCIPAASARSRDLWLHLHVDTPASPLEMRTGLDSRRLGLLLTSMAVKRGCELHASGK